MGVFRHNLAKFALNRAVAARGAGVYSPTPAANARESAEFGNGPYLEIALTNTRRDSADIASKHILFDVCNSVFRYPSPSGRLDNVPFKSPASFPEMPLKRAAGRSPAGFGGLARARLNGRHYVSFCAHGVRHRKTGKKGNSRCVSLRSQQCLQRSQAGFQPAATLRLNKAFWAPGQGPVRPLSRAEMPKQPPLSAGLAIWPTARPTQTNVTDLTNAACGRPVLDVTIKASGFGGLFIADDRAALWPDTKEGTSDVRQDPDRQPG